MKKITVERKIACFNELSPEHQEHEIEKIKNAKDGLCLFFENEYTACIERLHDIARNTKDKLIEFKPSRLYWSGGSQGWYYQHCTADKFLICRGYTKDMRTYRLSLVNVETYRAEYGKNNAEYYFEWDLILFPNNYAYRGDLADILKETSENSFPLPPAVLKTIRTVENQYRKEHTTALAEIEKVVQEFNDYYPENEEIADYFINNEIEFLVEEHEIMRKAI
jgi:hypothetical protein